MDEDIQEDSQPEPVAVVEEPVTEKVEQPSAPNFAKPKGLFQKPKFMPKPGQKRTDDERTDTQENASNASPPQQTTK